jgi:hypothetical protein
VDDAELLSEARRRLPAARKALAECIGDIPAATGGTGASGVSDRTGRLALTLIEGRDAAVADSDQLNMLMADMMRRCQQSKPIGRQLAQALDIIDRWAPTPKRRAALEANQRAAANDLLNRHDDHGNCTSCARDPKSFKEQFRRGLCVNCYRRVERINELYVEPVDMPPLNLVILFRERGKVTDRDIHNAMTGHARRDA